MIVAPFIRPPSGIGDTPPLPYYLYCLIGIAILAGGALYWTIWKLVLPHVFGFRLVQTKEVLKDGTVVTLVRKSRCSEVLSFFFAVLKRKCRMNERRVRRLLVVHDRL